MLRKNMFDSKSEENVYRHLKSNWSDKVEVKTHVPVFNVINYQEAKEHPEITDSEFNYLSKTNFDFVISTKSYEPLLAIEFDGLGYGYNNENEYVQFYKTKDPNRKWKLDVKFKVCELSGFPFCIVSFPELEKYADQFTIVDGIIGQVLANKEFDRRFDEDIHLLEQELADIDDPIERQAYVEYYGDERWFDSKWNNNPILRKGWRLINKLWSEEKLVKAWGTSIGWSPNLEEGYSLGSVHATLNNEKETKLNKEVKVRSFHCKGVSPSTLAEEIAQLVLFLEIADIYGVKVDD